MEAVRTKYLERVIDEELDQLAGELPAIAIEGPKGVGKTVTAVRRAGTVHRLDDPGEREVAGADPKRLIVGRAPVLIDEWQRLPAAWDLVRRAVDEGAPAGRFLLTGSAAPEVELHSGAGRIVSLRMRPLALSERLPGSATVSLAALLSGSRGAIDGTTDADLGFYVDEILCSGFPGIRDLTPRALRAQLAGYLKRIVERDFAELGHRVRDPGGLQRWMAAYAAAISTSTSYEKVRDAASAGEGPKPSRSGTAPYRDVLERLWVLEPVPAWSPSRNRIRRLSTPPKHQLADPALAAQLLGLGRDALLSGAGSTAAIPRDGTMLGALFESLVTLSTRVYAQASEATVGHLRTAAGEHEVDLIVRRADDRVVAVEVKLASVIRERDCRSLHWLAERIGDDLLDAAVISTGTDAYRRKDGIAVIPAALLGP